MIKNFIFLYCCQDETTYSILSRLCQYLIRYYSFSTFHTNVQMCFISIFYLTFSVVNFKVDREEKTVKATLTKNQQHYSYEEGHWATAKVRTQEVSFSSTQKYQLCGWYIKNIGAKSKENPAVNIWQAMFLQGWHTVTEDNRESIGRSSRDKEYCVGMFCISPRENCDIIELQLVFDHCF